jgi:2-polyprenyl-3-methyl-5-hydroxy-6-metoxy-1,4-benzoquinol methylase
LLFIENGWPASTYIKAYASMSTQPIVTPTSQIAAIVSPIVINQAAGCRVCDSRRLEPVIDLGQQPWCNHFLKAEEIGKEPVYPLRVVFCHDCRTAQLDYTVRKETMFGDHTYLSGVTRSLSEHFRSIAREVDSRFVGAKGGKSVLDIGSNDGTQLKHYRDLGYDVLGVESSKTTARMANESGISTLNEFFNLEVARRLQRTFDVINAAGVFFHLEELHSVSDGIRELLADDGVFVVQFLYMKRIMENVAFDQIYHEHLLYYNLATIEVLLKRHGLTLFDAYVAPIHGGSVIGFATHKGRRKPSDRLAQLVRAEIEDGSNQVSAYRILAKRIERMKIDNLAYLDNARQARRRIFGMGAPVKGNTLLNYFGIGTQYLECLVEKNELRRGLFSPGMHIPIRLERELTEPPHIYYVLAWNFKKEILANHHDLIQRGVEFFFPVNPQE